MQKQSIENFVSVQTV